MFEMDQQKRPKHFLPARSPGEILEDKEKQVSGLPPALQVQSNQSTTSDGKIQQPTDSGENVTYTVEKDQIIKSKREKKGKVEKRSVLHRTNKDHPMLGAKTPLGSRIHGKSPAVLQIVDECEQRRRAKREKRTIEGKGRAVLQIVDKTEQCRRVKRGKKTTEVYGPNPALRVESNQSTSPDGRIQQPTDGVKKDSCIINMEEDQALLQLIEYLKNYDSSYCFGKDQVILIMERFFENFKDKQVTFASMYFVDSKLVKDKSVTKTNGICSKWFICWVLILPPGHCFVVSNVKCNKTGEVSVYDSLMRRKYHQLTPVILEVVKTFATPDKHWVRINFVNVPKQKVNSLNCVLYTAAFCVELFTNGDLGEKNWEYDEDQMTSYLIKNLEAKEKFIPFNRKTESVDIKDMPYVMMLQMEYEGISPEVSAESKSYDEGKAHTAVLNETEQRPRAKKKDKEIDKQIAQPTEGDENWSYSGGDVFNDKHSMFSSGIETSEDQGELDSAWTATTRKPGNYSIGKTYSQANCTGLNEDVGFLSHEFQDLNGRREPLELPGTICSTEGIAHPLELEAFQPIRDEDK